MFPSFALLSGIALFSSVAAAVTLEIQVGGGLRFNPSFIIADPGDIVLFNFTSRNYSVTQSSFVAPCTPLTGGFDSGFVNAQNVTSNGNFPTWQLNVTDRDPIWIHCRQAADTAATHCGQGMVFAVNPVNPGGGDDPNDSFTAFKTTALDAGAQLGAPATNVTATQSSTGSFSGTRSTPTSTRSNGATSLNVDSGMLMTAFGVVVGLVV